MMLKFKACPKCQGDMSQCEDRYGKYLSCLQCGFLQELPEEAATEKRKRMPFVEDRQAA